MMKSINLLFTNSVLCLSLLILSSCTNSPTATTESKTPSPPPIAISITPTITHLPSSFPSATPTEKPFVIYPSHFNFPEWMTNSQTIILANPITERKGFEIISAKIMFLDALTGERYDIPFPSNAKAYFWYDNMHFGFLSDDFQVMHLINLSNGQVIEKNATIKSTRLLSMDDSFIPLTIRQDPLSPSESMFDYASSYWGSPYSIDTQYFANSDRSINEEPITVTDLETNQIIWQSNPSDGYSDVHFLWSPVKSSYLAMIVGRPSNTGFGFPIIDTTLMVIDVETGKTISSYKVDAGRIQWSPDGTKILYRNAISDYWNFGFSFTEAPCFFNLETRKESCIWRIPNRPLLNGQTLITTDDYQWGSDGKSIYFTYSYSSQDGMSADICNYNLVDGSFTCPTNSLTELSGWNIDWRYGWRIATYNLSPDGKYVYFCLDSNHPLSDDQSGPSQDGLIEINGTNLITWVSTQETSIERQFLYVRCSFYSALWRPLP
jgi:PBP1b-binding outer membrane lipoprotein LpoB